MASKRVNRLNAQFYIKNNLYRALLAEFAATMLLTYVGFAVNAQTTLSHNQSNGNLGNTIGWGLSFLFAIMMSYNITGSHLNPAISFCAWTFNELPFVHFILYSIVQTIAAFFGAMFAFVLYYDKINAFDGGVRQVIGPNATAGIFASYPSEHLSRLGGIIDQTSCTMIMTIMCYISMDEKNHIPKWAQPSFFALMLTVIGMGFGLNAGNSMNPARDFGPRLFTLFAGYGPEVFSYNNYGWFWIPIICPMFGTVLGGWIYKFMIGFQLSDPSQYKSEDSSSQKTLYSAVDIPPMKVMVKRSSSASTMNPIKV